MTLSPSRGTQNLNLEDQIESGESELKKLKAEENSLRRLTNAKKEKLATMQFRINKKHEDVKQYKRTVIEYGLLRASACERLSSARPGAWGLSDEAHAPR